MTDLLDDKEVVEFKEVILSEAIQSEALVNILVKKGILTQDELIEEIIRVKKEMVAEQARKRKFKQ